MLKDEEVASSLKGVLKGEGKEYERIYGKRYTDMNNEEISTRYDKEANVFCGYKVDYNIDIDVKKGSARLELDYWEGTNCEIYYLVLTK